MNLPRPNLPASTRPRLMVAPNGARRTKADHPALPMHPGEIAAEAAACQKAGAHALHLHVRDAKGRHSLDAGRYREAIAAVQEAAPGLDIQITTEAVGIYSVDAQLETLQSVRPKEASVSVREIARAPDLAPRLYAFCAEAGIVVQHILYSREDLALLLDWRAKGIVPKGPPSVLLVLGRYTPPAEADAQTLAAFVAALPGDIGPWMVCAFGKSEQARLVEAARMGGDLRLGFENNIARPDGTPAASTAANLQALVARLKAEAPSP